MGRSFVSPGPDVNTCQPRRVLVVEGDGAVRDLVAKLLRHLDLEPVEAKDAAGAVAALRRDGPPRAVILDTHLPALGGAAVLSTIRGDPDLAEVPVVTMGTGAHAPPAVAAHLTLPFRLAEFTTILLALVEPDALER